MTASNRISLTVRELAESMFLVLQNPPQFLMSLLTYIMLFSIFSFSPSVFDIQDFPGIFSNGFFQLSKPITFMYFHCWLMSEDFFVLSKTP